MAKPFIVEGLLLEKVIRRVGMPLTLLQNDHFEYSLTTGLCLTKAAETAKP